MGKKGVPEWLNSPLWSSDPSPNAADRLANYDAIFSLDIPDPEAPPPPPPFHPSPPPHERSRPTALSSDEDRLSSEGSSRRSYIHAEISRKIINLGELRRLASQGIPDDGDAGLRSTAWKILLGYLPNDRLLWAHDMEKRHSQYKAFKDELLVNPSEFTRRLDEYAGIRIDKMRCEGSGLLPRLEITHGEHPLSLDKTSVWNKYFQDMEIVEQIDRDVKRTHPDMQFFSGVSSIEKSNQEALRNILIIFSKLNPGIRYIQGMNEVLAPIFYVFRNDPDKNIAAYAEADTFFCFAELISRFRDNFCKQLDNNVVGVHTMIIKLSLLLRKHDEELWRHLEVTTKVDTQFYAFRWITLLLTREFRLMDALRIWDNLLSDPEGPQETLLRICCAMLILVRRRLLEGDFTANLKLLQNYPPTNISHLLHVADKLCRRHLANSPDSSFLC